MPFKPKINVLLLIVSAALAVLDFGAVFHYNDVECNVKHHSINLDLGDFLLWFDVAMIIGLIWTGLFVIFLKTTKRNNRKGWMAVLLAISGCCIYVFGFVWSIVGSMILFQDAIGCIAEKKFIGILSLLNLVIFWCGLSTIFSVTLTCNDKEDDDTPIIRVL